MTIKVEEITAGEHGKVGYNAILKSDPGKLNQRELGGEFGLKAVAFLNNKRSVIREITSNIRQHDLDVLKRKIQSTQHDPIKIHALQDAYKRSAESFNDPIAVRLEFHTQTHHALSKLDYRHNPYSPMSIPQSGVSENSLPDPHDEQAKQALLAFGKKKGIPIYKVKGGQYYLGNKDDLEAVLNFLGVGEKEKGGLLMIRERIATTKEADARMKREILKNKNDYQDDLVPLAADNQFVLPEMNLVAPLTPAHYGTPISDPEHVLHDALHETDPEGKVGSTVVRTAQADWQEHLKKEAEERKKNQNIPAF